MRFDDAQKKAYELAEKQARLMEAGMLANYNRAAKEIIADMEKIYARVLDRKVKPEDYYVTVIRYNRLTQLLDGITKQLNFYAKKAGAQILDLSAYAMNDMYYRRQFILASVGGGGVPYTFSPLDDRLVQLSVTGTVDAWSKVPSTIAERFGANINYMPQAGTITDILYNNRIQDIAKIQQVITQGFIQGKTIRNMTNDIMGVIDTAKYKAERIARTEFTRTANAGAYAATKDAEYQGIDVKRKWVATLDLRTRPVHAALDGQIVGVDEPFQSSAGEVMRPGEFAEVGLNMNCRCTVIDIIDGFEPELRRARKLEVNKDGKLVEVKGQSEVISYANYETWLKNNGVNPETYAVKK